MSFKRIRTHRLIRKGCLPKIANKIIYTNHVNLNPKYMDDIHRLCVLLRVNPEYARFFMLTDPAINNHLPLVAINFCLKRIKKS